MRHTFIAALLALAACASEPQLSPNIPPLILSGDITRADHQTYRELPFTVPPGTRQITIDFAYTNKENRTVIDLGLRDPQDQRGWSGGNKSHIEIGEFNATPSYRPGKIQSGEWKLVLGVPNTREGQTASYEATVTFSGERGSPNDEGVIAPATIPATKPGWFRGDFHMHTAHSDGSCDVDGARAPCPAIRTFEAARDGGLDFAAITDHNTITQLADIRLEQGRFPKTLLIPGMEITTFFGHANAIGVTDFVDFQLGSPRLPMLGKLFDELDAQGAILSVNHPGLPSGEICMGCGWTVKDTDWSRVAAIEVVNGSTLRTGGAEGPTSGIRFWDNLLKQGYRLTAIGGSDNHDATDRTGVRQSPIGTPTTVVYASELSTKAIIAGVRSGRAFVDVAGLPGATLEIKALAGKQDVGMGGEVRLAEDESAFIDVISANIPADARLTLVSANLVATQPTRVPAPRNDPLHRMDSFSVKLAQGAATGYIRPELRDAAGKLLLLGNPIYVRGE